MASSPWEWDEVLFIQAMEEYDISAHRPHPPGYPLFIAAAHVVRPLVSSDFEALQLIVLLGACLLPVAILGLLTELGFSRWVRFGAVLLTLFTPTIWFYGGTAFSDVPALTVTVCAGWILLRKNAGWSWSVASGIAIAAVAGFRPQNLLILLPFAAVAIARRRARDIFCMIAMAAVMGIVMYGSAIAVSGEGRSSIGMMNHQVRYVIEVDSVRNPIRPPVSRAWEDFFLDPYPTDLIAWSVFALGIVGLVAGWGARRREIILLLLAFVPLAVLSLFLLDIQAAERYSLSYALLFSVMAALGIEAIGSFVRSGRTAALVRSSLLALAVLALSWRTFFAISVTRSTLSPPMAVVESVQRQLEPGERVMMQVGLSPFGDAYFDHYDEISEDQFLENSKGFVIGLGPTIHRATRFRYENETLRRIARRRYFDVWFDDLETYPRFGEGWFGIEHHGSERWRWMGAMGLLLIPGSSSQQCVTLDMVLPEPSRDGARFEAEIDAGDVVVSEVGPDGHFEVAATVEPCERCFRTLRLSVSETFRPSRAGSDDDRELGAMLRSSEVGKCGS